MNTTSLVKRIVGSIVLMLGLVLVINPELIVDQPIPTDTFAAVERRIWWGLIVGVGLLILFHGKLRPWRLTLAATCCALLLGLLIARLIGIALDGSVPMQWAYVGLEVVILLLLYWWYRNVRKQHSTVAVE